MLYLYLTRQYRRDLQTKERVLSKAFIVGSPVDPESPEFDEASTPVFFVEVRVVPDSTPLDDSWIAGEADAMCMILSMSGTEFQLSDELAQLTAAYH